MASVDRFHRYCGNKILRYHPVDYQPFLFLTHLARKFLHEIGPVDHDNLWFPLVRVVRQYRFTAAVAPLPFNDRALTSNLSEDRLREIAEYARHACPSLGSLAVAVINALLEVARSTEAPLLDKLSELLRETSDDQVVLIRDSRLCQAVETALQSRGFGDVRVFTGTDVRPMECFGRIVVVGPAGWYDDTVFSAPRAPRIDVVYFNGLHGRWRPNSVFVRPLGIGSAADEEIDRDGDAETDERWPEIDWRGVLRQATGQEQPGAAAPELVEARGFSLYGGEVVFLEDGDTAKSLVIDLEESGDRLVRRIPTRRIQPGMFVLLRTGGGGDYVAPLADHVLGSRAAFLREKQRHWKQLLRQEIACHGLSSVTARLHDLGAVRNDESNVQYWASERCIHPRDPADFEALLRLVGLDDQVRNYWTWMHWIFRAHVKAGHIIRRRLLEQVRHADLSNLRGTGRLEFVLSETEGGLVALCVEAVAPETIWIASSRIARPFVGEV